MSKTQFKPKKRVSEVIEKLIADISSKIGIEEKILTAQSKKAFKNWEKATHIKTVNLFKSEPHHISAIIPHILTFFETEFAPIIGSESELRNALEMTNLALYEMYNLSEMK